jgi:hypothetical protein
VIIILIIGAIGALLFGLQVKNLRQASRYGVIKGNLYHVDRTQRPMLSWWTFGWSIAACLTGAALVIASTVLIVLMIINPGLRGTDSW